MFLLSMNNYPFFAQHCSICPFMSMARAFTQPSFVAVIEDNITLTPGKLAINLEMTFSRPVSSYFVDANQCISFRYKCVSVRLFTPVFT